jgi:hypothetical protein
MGKTGRKGGGRDVQQVRGRTGRKGGGRDRNREGEERDRYRELGRARVRGGEGQELGEREMKGWSWGYRVGRDR